MKRNTKRQQEMIRKYQQAEWHTLIDAYNSYSYNKHMAYISCVKLAEKLGAIDGWRIPTASKFMFTFAFQYYGSNGELRQRYETAQNSYDFEVIEDE